MKTSNKKQLLKLTIRQYEILRFIVTYTLTNNYQPDLKTVAETFHIAQQSVYARLASIERRGWIERQINTSRAIKLSAQAIDLGKGKLKKKDWVE